MSPPNPITFSPRPQMIPSLPPAIPPEIENPKLKSLLEWAVKAQKQDWTADKIKTLIDFYFAYPEYPGYKDFLKGILLSLDFTPLAEQAKHDIQALEAMTKLITYGNDENFWWYAIHSSYSDKIRTVEEKSNEFLRVARSFPEVKTILQGLTLDISYYRVSESTRLLGDSIRWTPIKFLTLTFLAKLGNASAQTILQENTEYQKFLNDTKREEENTARYQARKACENKPFCFSSDFGIGADLSHGVRHSWSKVVSQNWALSPSAQVFFYNKRTMPISYNISNTALGVGLGIEGIFYENVKGIGGSLDLRVIKYDHLLLGLPILGYAVAADLVIRGGKVYADVPQESYKYVGLDVSGIARGFFLCIPVGVQLSPGMEARWYESGEKEIVPNLTLKYAAGYP